MTLTLTLDTIYDALISLFPCEKSIIYNAIRQLIVVKKESEEESYIQTMGVDYNGNIYVSEKFWETYMQEENNLKTVLLHELYHRVTNDTSFITKFNLDDPEIEIKRMAANIAQDCRINAAIYLTSNIKDSGKFFKEFYKEESIKEWPIMSLLTPFYEKYIPNTQLTIAYNSIYKNSSEDIVSFENLYYLILDYFRKNPDQAPPLNIAIFIGNHGELDTNLGTNSDILSKDIQEKLNEAIRDHLKDVVDNSPADKAAGNGIELTQQILNKALGIDQKFNLSYFKTMSFNNIMHNVRLEMDNVSRYKEKSILIPQQISRSDIFKLMNKQIPLNWDIFSFRPVKTDRKIPIYLDVSGSMWDGLPVIIEMLINIKDDIDYVWGFSNKVHKHTIEDLEKSNITSTGGTDFDCIIEHATENNFEHLLIITDGYASCKQTYGQMLPQFKDVTVVLCTNCRSEENYFCKTYNNVVQIEDVTSEHV